MSLTASPKAVDASGSAVFSPAGVCTASPAEKGVDQYGAEVPL